MKKTLGAILFTVATGLLLVMPVAATKPDPEHKVDICHRTASDTNPYVFISVDEASLSPGHLDNADPGHKPRFWKSDGTFRGVPHLKGDAKDDYLAQGGKSDCDDIVIATPTPTPSETPVETPTVPTVTPTPSDTPSETPPMPPTGGGTPPDTALEAPTGSPVLPVLLLIAGLAGLAGANVWQASRKK